MDLFHGRRRSRNERRMSPLNPQASNTQSSVSSPLAPLKSNSSSGLAPLKHASSGSNTPPGRLPLPQLKTSESTGNDGYFDSSRSTTAPSAFISNLNYRNTAPFSFNIDETDASLTDMRGRNLFGKQFDQNFNASLSPHRRILSPISPTTFDYRHDLQPDNSLNMLHKISTSMPDLSYPLDSKSKELFTWAMDVSLTDSGLFTL